jgi:hypothetical protein
MPFRQSSVEHGERAINLAACGGWRNRSGIAGRPRKPVSGDEPDEASSLRKSMRAGIDAGGSSGILRGEWLRLGNPALTMAV